MYTLEWELKGSTWSLCVGAEVAPWLGTDLQLGGGSKP